MGIGRFVKKDYRDYFMFKDDDEHKTDLGEVNCFGDMIGYASGPMGGVYRDIIKLAEANIPIFVTGESGTGKELTVKYIHGLHPNGRDSPFVKVNCAAIPEGLMESELFGHEKGAFTGAINKKIGKFRLAHKGTLFLDEIASSSIPMQEKILIAAEYGEIEPVGHDKAEPCTVDVKIIAATNQDIDKAISEGRFKGDLYFRLAKGLLHLPPLRERDGDIRLLAEYLLEKSYNYRKGPKYKKTLKEDAVDFLEEQPWPGNVREMDNLIVRTATMSDKEEIGADDLKKYLRKSKVRIESITIEEGLNKGKTRDEIIKQLDRELLVTALKKYHGNNTKASKALGVQRTYMSRLKTKFDIRPEEYMK